MTNREELIKFVLDAYWHDMLVVVPSGGGCSDDNLFYLQDCGYFMGCAISGSWEDVWEDDAFSDAIRDACGCDDVSVFGSVPTAVIRAIVATLDRKEDL